MPLEQGSQVGSGGPLAALEKAPLLSDGAEGPGVGNGEGKPEFILARKSLVNAPKHGNPTSKYSEKPSW